MIQSQIAPPIRSAPAATRATVTFIRFVVGADSDNAAWLTGIITEAQYLDDEAVLYEHERALLEKIFDWFDQHLPCPPFQKNRRSGEWTAGAVCWFRSDAKQPIDRMWDIVAILREHGVRVRIVRSENPGAIVYSDEYQVVAETPARGRARPRP